LLRLLDPSARGAVVWIEGPPGAGKTALVQSWISQRHVRAAWITLDATSEASRFFAELERVARAGGMRARLPRFEAAALSTPGAFARRFFHALASARRRPSILVLDDHHELPSSSLLHAMLREAFQELDGAIGVIVASRAGPPPALTRLAVSGALLRVPPAALALTPAEARAIARLRGLEAPEAIALAAGWPAALVLLSAGGVSSPRAARSGVFDYLATEVMSKLDAPVRRTLERTSIVPAFDAELAVRLADEPRAAQIVEDLADRAWLTERIAGPRPAYRVHHLFRAYLRNRALDALGAAGVAELARVAADHLFGRGDVDGALETLADGGAWDALARALAQRGPALLASGRAETVSRWIARLPPSLVTAEPGLLHVRGLASFPARPAQAIADLSAAFDASRAAGDTAGAYRSWAAAVNVQLVALENVEPLSGWLERLRTLRAEALDAGTEAAVIAAALGAVHAVRPSDLEVRVWGDRATRVVLGTGDAGVRLAAGGTLLFLLSFYALDLRRARLLIDALRPVVASEDSPSAEAILCHVAEGIWHAHTGDGARARTLADRGFARAERSGVRTWDPLLHATRVFGALEREELEAASDALVSFERAVRGAVPLVRCSYHLTYGVTALRRGNARAALEQSRVAEMLASGAGHRRAEALCRVSVAAAARACGAEGPSLDEAAEACARASYPYGEMGARLLAASAALKEGDEGTAAAAVSSALSLAERIGCLNSVWVGRTATAELCALAIERGLAAGHARAIVSARGLAAPPRARTVAEWPWPARVEALGGAGLRGDRPARNGSKVPLKPLELLRLLVVHGERGVPPARVAEALWPDADGDRARHALETAVWRLRRLLGDGPSVVQRGGRLALDATRVWVDAWAFERLAASARTLRDAGALDAAARAVAAARCLYGGELFDGEDDHPAVVAARDRLARLRDELDGLPALSRAR
jgi:hypothetical protein